MSSAEYDDARGDKERAVCHMKDLLGWVASMPIPEDAGSVGDLEPSQKIKTSDGVAVTVYEEMTDLL